MARQGITHMDRHSMEESGLSSFSRHMCDIFSYPALPYDMSAIEEKGQDRSI